MLQTTSFATLPTEILLLITEILSIDARVTLMLCNKRLRRIVTDSSLWSKIELIRDFSQSNAYISRLYQRGRVVGESRIQSRACNGRNTEASPLTTRQVNSMGSILGCILGSIIPVVGPVSVTDLNVRGLAEQFTDSHLMQIARWSPHLSSVTVSGTSVSDAGIQYLFGAVTTYQKSIEVLRDGVSRSRVTSSARNRPTDEREKSHSTASLKLPPPPAPPYPKQNSMDFTVREYNCSHDDGDDSGGSMPFTCDTDSLEQRERQLVDHITQDLSTLLPAAFLNTLHQSSSSYSQFSSTAIPEEEAEVTRPRCPHIRHLHLSGSRPIVDKTLARIAYNAVHLVTLDLTTYAGSSRISDDGAMLVARLCSRLENFMISGCSQITDDTLMVLSGWDKATEISGGDSRQPVMRDVKKMWTRRFGFESSRLKRLEISGCFQVTDFGLTAVLVGCSGLEALDLEYCWRITDNSFVDTEESVLLDQRMLFWKGLRANGVASKQLKHISMRFCYLITDVAVNSLLRKDPSGNPIMYQLQKVDVTSCQRVTRRSDNSLLFWDETDQDFQD